MNQIDINTRIESEPNCFDLLGRFVPKGETSHTLSLTSFDRVLQRAYTLYLESGAKPGHDLDNWLLAEQQVMSQREAGFLN